MKKIITLTLVLFATIMMATGCRTSNEPRSAFYMGNDGIVRKVYIERDRSFGQEPAPVRYRPVGQTTYAQPVQHGVVIGAPPDMATSALVPMITTVPLPPPPPPVQLTVFENMTPYNIEVVQKNGAAVIVPGMDSRSVEGSSIIYNPYMLMRDGNKKYVFAAGVAVEIPPQFKTLTFGVQDMKFSLVGK
jgi:hypothetical protein